jgi:ankyrin repeat protein
MWVLLLVFLVGNSRSASALDNFQSHEFEISTEFDPVRAEKEACHLFGWTSLTLAVLHNDPPSVKKFLEQGRDVNTSDTEQRTLLQLACEYGLEEMARLLVEKGADVNRADREGYSPLNAALDLETLTLARFLLEKGAEADKPALKGGVQCTLLKKAILNQRTDVIDLLREHGASPNPSPAKRARIEPGTATETNGKSDDSLLADAIDRNDLNAVRLLLSKGLNPNKGANENFPPLYNATARNSLEMVKLLIEAGADVNFKYKGERSLLDVAYECGFSSLVEYYENECHLKRSQPNTALGEQWEVPSGSHVSIPSTSSTKTFSLEAHRTVEETFCHKVKMETGEERIEKEKRIYLTFTGSPDRILLDTIQFYNGKQSEPEGCGAMECTLNWLEKDRLIAVEWSNHLSGSGQYEEYRLLVLEVNGKRVRGILSDRCSAGDKYGTHYAKQLDYTPRTGKLVFSASNLAANPEEVDDSVTPPSSPTPDRILYQKRAKMGNRVVREYILKEGKIAAFSEKKYILDANALPVVDVAHQKQMSLPELRKLNPVIQKSLYHKGPLLLEAVELSGEQIDWRFPHLPI